MRVMTRHDKRDWWRVFDRVDPNADDTVSRGSSGPSDSPDDRDRMERNKGER